MKEITKVPMTYKVELTRKELLVLLLLTGHCGGTYDLMDLYEDIIAIAYPTDPDPDSPCDVVEEELGVVMSVQPELNKKSKP